MQLLRRSWASASAAAALTTLLAASSYSPVQALTNQEALKLEEYSRTSQTLPLEMGLRALDLIPGNGPAPTLGSRVYVHYKVWNDKFDNGQPIDASYFKTRPLELILGENEEMSLNRALDIGVRGMKEGGWRRLIVPPALGYPNGLSRQESGTNRPIPPGEPLYVDLRLMDGGSGRCDQLLRIEGFKKSISCERGKP